MIRVKFWNNLLGHVNDKLEGVTLEAISVISVRGDEDVA